MQTVYLAAPFFNPTQSSLCAVLESAILEAGFVCASPRLQGVCPPSAPPALRRETFNRNVENIKHASLVVAVLEFPLNAGELRVVRYHEGAWQSLSNPLHLPDTGVVFEMGVAHVYGVPIVGFRQQPAVRYNLMLAEACGGIATGLPQLRGALGLFRDRGFFNLPAHTGDIV